MNPNETVHFKFERFETESDYDYFVIGNPYEFDYLYQKYFDDYDDDYSDTTMNPIDDYYNDTTITNGVQQYNRSGLMLDGTQVTGIWVTAESIQNFDIYFYRRVCISFDFFSINFYEFSILLLFFYLNSIFNIKTIRK